MLIDLYERPHSPEAPKSRALIDKIFSLSGPDGGVVGGEDGITTQRPLRDGGREAWDMMRRLREKSWQKAGLDPDVLWTDAKQDPFPAGVPELSSSGLTSSKQDETRRESEDFTETPRPSFADTYYELIKDRQDESDKKPEIEALNPGRLTQEAKPQFYDHPTVQNHGNQNQGQQVRHTAMPGNQAQHRQQQFQQQLQRQQQHQHDPNQQMWSQPPMQQQQQQSSFMMRPHPSFNPRHIDPTTLTPADTHTGFPSSRMTPVPDPNPTLGPGPSPGPGSAAAGQQLLDPSSMIDFDWDQWDAVFGQPLPVVDETMDLDAGGPPSLFGNGGGGGGSLGNWADFG